MKTISGKCVSMKEISLSKAAKVLSKFVSADNGASHVISAYLHRASASFNELDQLHKELKPSHAHKKKHKKHRTETGDGDGTTVENSVRSVEINQELSHGHVKSNSDYRRQPFGNENADKNDRKSTPTIVKFSQELNGSIDYQTGNVSGSEKKHKKNKKKQHDVEASHEGDGGKQGNEGDGDPGMKEANKQKREKKKQKEGAFSFSNSKGEVENLEGENAKGQQKENGGLVGSQNLQTNKKKKYDTGSENTLCAEEAKIEQRRKRKNEDVEGSLDDKSGELTKKRKKRKHEGNL